MILWRQGWCGKRHNSKTQFVATFIVVQHEAERCENWKWSTSSGHLVSYYPFYSLCHRLRSAIRWISNSFLWLYEHINSVLHQKNNLNEFGNFYSDYGNCGMCGTGDTLIPTDCPEFITQFGQMFPVIPYTYIALLIQQWYVLIQ